MRCHPYLPSSQGRPTFVRSTSPAQGELRVPAAGGGRRELAISAAVENPEDQRKPDGIFGHRKVDRCRKACHAPPGDGGVVPPSRRIGRTFLLLVQKKGTKENDTREGKISGFSPSLDPPSLKRPNGACEPLLDFPGMHPGLYVGAGIPDSPLCFPLRGNCGLALPAAEEARPQFPQR